MQSHPALRGAAVVLALSSITGLARAATDNAPRIIICKRDAIVACGADGVCIADSLIDRYPITFDLRAKRYRSALGSGRISNRWDLEDGRHAILTTSPPASAQFTFTTDWRTAYADRSDVRYACEITRLR